MKANLSNYVSKALNFLVPKPALGKIGYDLFYVILIVSFQVAIIPSVISYSRVDILTLWLIYTFVRLNVSQGMLIAFVGAWTLENHGTYPAGFYFCSYWVMGILINLIKNHISWRNILPWLVVFVCSQTWLILFEVLVFSIKTGSLIFFGTDYVIGVLIRMTFAILSGIVAAKMILQNTEDNPV